MSLSLGKTESSAFQPDWVSPPGDTIEDLMQEQGIPPPLLAAQLGHGEEFLLGLISGEQRIDQPLATKLSEVLGSTPEFWEEREYRYRRRLATQKIHLGY